MNFRGGFTVAHVLLYNGYILHHVWHQQLLCLQLQVFPVVHIGLMNRNAVWMVVHGSTVTVCISLFVSVGDGFISSHQSWNHSVVYSYSFFSLQHHVAVFKICVYFKKNLLLFGSFFPHRFLDMHFLIYNLLVWSIVIIHYIHPS